MGKFRILRRPGAALVAIAFPLVAAGAFTLGAGHDLNPTDEAAASVPEVSAETPSGDPLATSRQSLQKASLPISFLSGGLTQLTDGGNQLNDGAGQLADGITQAHDGTVQLADGWVQYRDGIGQLGDGASQISGGVDQVVDQLTGFGEQQSAFTAQLEAAATQVAAFPTPGSQEAAAQIRGVIDTLNTQGLGPQTLDQLAELKGGARQLSGELNDPSGQFLTATNQIGDATVQLRDGLGQLDDGGQQLRAGTQQLVTSVEPVPGIVDGIKTNVTDATTGLPSAKELSAPNASPVATPVDSPSTPVAPYLISALVAVGAVGAVSLVRVLSRDSRLRWIAAATASLAVGICAALAFAFTAPDAAVGALVGAGAFLLVSAAAYLAAAGAIQRLLGATVGQAVNVALLLVQVVVCGAAYASNAAIWGQLSAFMPMAYTAAGAREIGNGALTSTGWVAVALTAALLVVSGLVYRGASKPSVNYA
ncbi:phage infection protein [Rhodococcoides kyotonense]|uniref:Putative membrane protein n=1 Tax=Rhodococcoides kyotonense TaxID=398843 RepID=A0A239L2X4_9NOCA|nr:phage infection protein [Rhodococcus kyotonensis]SNT24946.1 putative membrane protein [Rhodococcus kyotonensis]